MSHRQQILQLLHHYEQTHSDEANVVNRFKDFVMAYENCFLRLNEHGHITASCFLLSPSRKEILLTHHKKIGRWLQLGGHADGDSDVLRVALTEAYEESGIEGITPLDNMLFDIDIHHIAEHHDVTAHFHYDVRFLLVAPRREFTVSSESHNLAWLPITHIADDERMSISVKRMARKFLNSKFYE